jgi:hypothetical protein
VEVAYDSSREETSIIVQEERPSPYKLIDEQLSKSHQKPA